jgi:hypothetical protein
MRSHIILFKALVLLVDVDIIMPALFKQKCVALNNANLIYITDKMSVFFDLRKFSQAHGREKLFSNLSDHHFLVDDAISLSSKSLTGWWDCQEKFELDVQEDTLWMPIVRHQEEYLFILFEGDDEGHVSALLTLLSNSSGNASDYKKLIASVRTQSRYKSTQVSSLDSAFHKPASFSFATKGGKPNHRERLVDALNKAFPAANTLVVDVSEQIRKGSTKYSEKSMVFVRNTQTLSSANVTVGKCGNTVPFMILIELSNLKSNNYMQSLGFCVWFCPMVKKITQKIQAWIFCVFCQCNSRVNNAKNPSLDFLRF